MLLVFFHLLPKIAKMRKIKIAAFNVENLFARPKIFNFRDHSIGDSIMDKINDLRKILKKDKYSSTEKDDILTLYNQLKDYILIREDRGKLFKKRGWSVTGVKADGKNSWDGSIEYKKARFSDIARENTAKVMKKVNADIACVIEADNRIALKNFDTHLLNSKYKHEMLIDGNDRRGIDVGLLSKFVFGEINTHIYEKVGRSTVFSRDCLELEVKISDDISIFFLINHFKSKGYDLDGRSSAKRTRQSEFVAKYLQKYDLTKDLVVVAGDLNDTPNSNPLKPLLDLNGLHDVLEIQYGSDISKRWTYHYNDFEQIDYLLISDKMKSLFLEAGVERRGMYNLRKLTTDSGGRVAEEEQFDTVTHWTNQASDHGAVWCTFDLDLF